MLEFTSVDSTCNNEALDLTGFTSTNGCGGGQGPQGPQGFSAYQIAVFNGFIGTEEEWLASLQGTPGAGFPTGGTANQVVYKVDGTNYNAQWASIPTILGYTPVTETRTLTINGTTYDLSANRSWTVSSGSGTVTSVAALTLGTTGTDVSSTVANSTTDAVITLNIPTASSTKRGALSSADWTTFNSKQSALSGTGFVKISGSTISYDNSTYYLASNPSGFTSNVGTVTSVAALTLGTSGTDVSSTVATGTSTPIITLNLPTASATNRGLLSSANWTTFNNKQNALGYTPANILNPIFSTSIQVDGVGVTVGSYTPYINTIASFIGNVNDYQLAYIQNLSGGSNASADFVAYNDVSDVNSYFVDMGISSSNYTSGLYNIFPANSGYLYTGGGVGLQPSHLYIGTGTANSDLVLFTGGTDVSNKAITIKSATQNVLIGSTTDDGVNNLQVTGGIKSTGDINIVGGAYADANMGSDPHQLATKEYVDNSVSAGLHIHTPVRVERHGNLTATYVDGGTTPTITQIASGSILTSVGHGLSENDMIVFTVSGNGIIAGDTYFVFQILSSSTFNISLTLNGPAITTLTNGTGLSLTSRANSGVGATLTNAGTQAALVISTVTLAVTNRVLVLGQTNGWENGVYTVTNTGSPSTNWILTRATDADRYGLNDPNTLGGGDYFFINEGTPGAGESYVLNNTGEIIFGTTSIGFTKFSAAPTYSGTAPIDVTGQVISLVGAVSATNGGTGTTTVTTGDLLYGSASNVWSKLPLGVAYKSLVVNGTGTQLEWNAVALDQTSAVSGQLGVANGGTGATTLTGIVVSSGTSAFTGVAGTASQLLRRNAGNTAYEFFTPTYISLTALSASAPLSYNNTTGAFTISQATTSTNGYLSSTDWNTFNGKQAALGFTPYNATNPANFIPLTALSSTATGLTYTNTTGVFSLTSGYVIPTTTEETNWNTAYTNRITSLTTTGTSGSASLITNTLNIPTYTLVGLGGQAAATNLTSLSGLSYVSSAFVKMTGAGTFSLDTTAYYPNSNPSGFTSNTGTVTSVAALTLGTTGTDVSSTVANGSTAAVITLNIPTASAANRGALSSTDWSTFNGKQAALSGTGFVKSTAGTISYDTNTYITGNQTITLSGAITGSGATAITTTLAASSVSISNINATGTPSNSTYLRGDGTWSASAGGGITLADLSATAPIQYNNTTGNFFMDMANAAQDGYLSSTDWILFNGKQDHLTLTTTGSSGAATLVGSTLNIPQYSGGGGSGITAVFSYLQNIYIN